MRGKLCGVGVGPGDPELVTYRAIKTLEECDCIILPASPKEDCRAYQIVKVHFPGIDEKEIVEVPFPMERGKVSCAENGSENKASAGSALEMFHSEVAQKVVSLCEEGKDVAFPVIGDPSLYSTFAYIEDIVKSKGVEVVRIAGVNSFSAVAATVCETLAIDKEELHIIPGSSDLEAALSLFGTKVFMKNKKKMKELVLMLREYEAAGRGVVKAVTHCGTEEEVIYGSASEIPEDAGYLTTIVAVDRKD